VEHDRTTQIVEYGRGVDIAWYDGMTGGACSIGLSRHVRQAYQFLFECYVPDDEIAPQLQPWSVHYALAARLDASFCPARREVRQGAKTCPC
jgi:hypothetical protein